MRNTKLFMLMALSALLFAPCNASSKEAATVTDVPALTEAEVQAGVFTPEVMWKMGRVGSHSLSPDGKTLLYTITYYSMEENRGTTAIYTQSAEGGERTRIAESGSSPVWSPDGATIYYLSDGQLWRMDARGRKRSQMSNVEGGIESFGIAPTGDRLFYTARTHVKPFRSGELHPDMAKSQAKIYDDLMVRHWNYWEVGDYSHIFVAEIRGGKMMAGVDILEGEPWDAPMAPYFDAAEIAWSNSGERLAYTCKKQTGTDYAVSTNSDIYVYDVKSGTTKNICEGHNLVGYDKYPAWSLDDSRIAFTSMRRPGNEADKTRIMVYTFADDKIDYLTRDFDYNADNLVWENEGSILFVSPIEATHQVCRVNLAGNVEVLTNGDHDLSGLNVVADKAVVAKQSISQAAELNMLSLTDGALTPVTDINAEIYASVTMGEVQKLWIPTTDGKKMLVWVILPPNFDPSQKYPALLYCQGGPQSVVGGWSYRWNFQLMASQGYVVVAPNRRGVPSFGQEWCDQISGDYSGQNIQDLFSAIDYVAENEWVDAERMGCVGASYGGYSSFFIAGHHEGRFKAFIAHCGIFNFESMYGSTEELFFVNNDYGGPYWSSNPTARSSYANSPHKFVDKWDTPILIITGENDFRVPYAQSLEAFTAARVKGVPARLVSFENEAHQVFKPQNSMVWNREFFGWLKKYLK